MFLSRVDRRLWILFNISISVYMSTLDASIVNISLPTIVRTLNTDLKAVAWVVTGYLIVITGCLLLVGRLADLFGQRRMYLVGLLTFTVGSALCGVSPSITFLIGSRMVQGLGAASSMVNGMAIVATAFPEKGRGQALGILGSIVSVGFLTGPLIGGFLVEHLGWRSVFFINLPIGAAGIVISLKTLDEDGPTKKVPLDLWGAVLLLLCITSLLLFLNRAGQGSTPVLSGLLCFFVFSFVLFILFETRTPSPLMDLRLFKRPLFAPSLGASLLSAWAMSAHTFIMPFFLQGILNFSPSKVGMLMFPVSLTTMVVAPLGGKLSDRIGVRLPATLGLLLLSLSIFSFSFLDERVSEYHIILRQVMLGWGIGLFAPGNNSAIIGSLPREMVGLASSFPALSRNLGLVIGVAVAEMVVALGPYAGSGDSARGVPSLISLHNVWKLSLIVGLAAVVLSWGRKGKADRSGSRTEGPLSWEA
jgi:EmrB/QacA subfamily drug resistance transporter